MSRAGRLKVLLLAQASLSQAEVPPQGSGAHLAATLAGLADHFEVLPVLAEGETDVASQARRSLRRAVPAWVRGLRQDVLTRRHDKRFAARAVALGRAFRPDILYARSEYLALSGPRVARALGVPLVLEVNGLLARDVRTMYRSPLEPFGAWSERAKLRRADAIVTVSPGLARLLERSGADPRKITVVPNSVDPARLAAPARPTGDTPVVIGWIGHLMQWHVESLELLIDLAADVVRAVPAVEFSIIGGGPGLDGLQARAAAAGAGTRFRFMGSVPYADVPQALREVDLGVIPAVFDYAFPVKLVEFGAAGIPVVAPQSASLDEQLAAHVEYEPFAAGDAASLHAALVRLARDPARRSELGAALQHAVRTRFTWTATGRALAEVVERVVAEPRP